MEWSWFCSPFPSVYLIVVHGTLERNCIFSWVPNASLSSRFAVIYCVVLLPPCNIASAWNNVSSMQYITLWNVIVLQYSESAALFSIAVQDNQILGYIVLYSFLIRWIYACRRFVRNVPPAPLLLVLPLPYHYPTITRNSFSPLTSLCYGCFLSILPTCLFFFVGLHFIVPWTPSFSVVFSRPRLSAEPSSFSR